MTSNYRVGKTSNGTIDVYCVEFECEGEWYDAFEDPSKELCESVVTLLNKVLSGKSEKILIQKQRDVLVNPTENHNG